MKKALISRRFIFFIIPFFLVLIAYKNGDLRNNEFIKGDGYGYYAYLPAIFIYHDLQYNFIDKIKGAGIPIDDSNGFRRIVDGRVINITFIGNALLWLPFFLLAHFLSWLFGFPTDGYSYFYQLSVFIAALFYILAGLWALRKLLKEFEVGELAISLCLLLVVFATPMIYYSIDAACFSHIYSFSAISFFGYYVKRITDSPKKKYIFYLAIILSIIALIRPSNLIVLFSIPFLAGSYKNLIDLFRYILSNFTTVVLALIISIGIAFLQPLLYFLQVGKFFVWSYQGVGFNFLEPNIINILFSYRKGLFLYSPILLLALAGLSFIFKKSIFQFISYLVFLFLVVYLLSSWWCWYYGMSFGNRAFIDFLAYFAIPLSLLLNSSRKIIQWSVYLICAALLIINLIQFNQYRRYIWFWDMNKEMYWQVFLKSDGRKYSGIFWDEERHRSADYLYKELYENAKVMDSIVVDFENDSKGNITNEIFYSGTKSLKLNKNGKSPEIRHSVLNCHDSLNYYVVAECKVYFEKVSAKDIFFNVLDIKKDSQLYSYSRRGSFILKKGEWNNFFQIIKLSKCSSDSLEINFYIEKFNKKTVYLDEMKLTVFQKMD